MNKRRSKLAANHPNQVAAEFNRNRALRPNFSQCCVCGCLQLQAREKTCLFCLREARERIKAHDPDFDVIGRIRVMVERISSDAPLKRTAKLKPARDRRLLSGIGTNTSRAGH